MIVEILVADHIGRNIPRRGEPLFTAVTFDGPLLKVVRLGQRLCVIAHLIRSGERVFLTGPGIVSLPTRRYLARPAFDNHSAGIAIRTHVNTIFTWTQN